MFEDDSQLKFFILLQNKWIQYFHAKFLFWQFLTAQGAAREMLNMFKGGLFRVSLLFKLIGIYVVIRLSIDNPTSLQGLSAIVENTDKASGADSTKYKILLYLLLPYNSSAGYLKLE